MILLAESAFGGGRIALLAALLLLPRVLQRWRVPAPITAFGIGIAAALGLDVFHGDPAVDLLSQLGIASLFLAAGMEVDLHELRAQARTLAVHVTIGASLLVGATLLLVSQAALAPRVAAITALAVLTPSAGFILDSLSSLGLYRDERVWVRSKVIAAEFLALGLLVFVGLGDLTAALLALAVIAAMILLLPLVLRAFAALVLPHTPRSEFAFLVLLAVVCASVTKELGVYYLVGAFVVGVTARRFRERLPALSSDTLVHAVEAFTSIAVPFYFFRAGTLVRGDDLTPVALAAGVGFVVASGALRAGAYAVHDVFARRDDLRSALRKSVPMLPTLVFSIVCVEILRAPPFAASPTLLGALLVAATLSTVVPTFLLPGLRPPEITVGAPEFAPGPEAAPVAPAPGPVAAATGAPMPAPVTHESQSPPP